MLDHPPERAYRPEGSIAGSGVSDGRPATENIGLMMSSALWGLWRHKFVVMLCLVLVPVLAAIGLSRVTPRYTAYASVMYDPSQYNVQAVQSIFRSDPINDEVISTQVEVAKNLKASARLAEQFHLYDNPEFNYSLRPKSALSRHISSLVRRGKGALASVVALVSPSSAASMMRAPKVMTAEGVRQSVIAAVQQATGAEAVHASHVITIAFTSKDPALAASCATALANIYIADQLQLKFDAVGNAEHWLEDRAQELQKQVQANETRISEYQNKAGLTKGVQAGLATEEVSRLSDSLVTARNELAQAEGQVSASQGNGSGAEAAISPSVVALRSQRDILQAQLESLLSRLGPNHPNVISLRQQIAVLQYAVNAETGQVTRASAASLHAARIKVAGLQQQLDMARSQLAAQGEVRIPLEAMQREADASRNLLQTVLESIQRLTQQTAIEQPDARLVSAALPPDVPSSPKTKPLLAAALLLGLALGILAAYLLEITQHTFRSGIDLEGALGLPCLAQIPQIGRRKQQSGGIEQYIVEKPFSLAAEQVRALRISIWLGASRPKVLAITAARPGEGKTTTTLCLGRSAAMSGERAIIVECDARKASFSKVLSLTKGGGLLEFLAGRTQLADIVRRDKLTSLDIIPVGSAGTDRSQTLFMSQKMTALLEDLSERYDLVLLDLPPVMAMTDTRIIASRAEATLMCVRWQDTPRATVKHALGLLRKAHAEVKGVALTRINSGRHSRSGLTDAEAYHSRYAPYYHN